MQNIGKTLEDLIDQSKKWELQVDNVKAIKDRIHVFLLRPTAIRVGLIEATRNTNIILQQISQENPKVRLDPLCDDEKSITSLRLKYLTNSIQNLYLLDSECKKRKPDILISSKSSSKSDDGYMILCGTVLNSKTGAKESNLTGEDFIKLRQNEMTLIAQHKYGVRVATDTKWKEFIAHLGESAAIFELLQTKASSAVKINFDHPTAGSSKGASFVLYNCARLETIIKTYNEKVEEGLYPPLPEIKDVDLSLLTQEDEWILVFNYILGLPSLINNCIEINEKSCEFRPHLICSFLSSMVRVFSQYYRKVRILTEPRKHLLPVIFARMHMLIVLNDTLKTCLRILNIKSVSQM
ncbi:DALR anticodon binding domain-containing protein [Phthorimaea operculella]|nr:DALR anticodon binding domain-containing protein [Phthorimaea operculella]